MGRGRLTALMPWDGDDWVGEPPEGRYTRDRARALGGDIWLIAKLEKPQAIEHLEGILEIADGVMVDRRHQRPITAAAGGCTASFSAGAARSKPQLRKDNSL